MKYVFEIYDLETDFSLSLKKILSSLDLLHADVKEKSILRTVILDEINGLKRKIQNDHG